MSRMKIWLLVSCVALIALIALANTTQHFAMAQEASTPLPSPNGNGGSATWTIGETTYASKYPKGGLFTIEASSSGGEITNATLYIMFTPTSRTRTLATFDTEKNSWVADWLGQGTPQWVYVNYYWILTDAAGNSYQTDITNEVYEDTTHEWNHVESEDISVYAEGSIPDEYVDGILDAMAQQREFYRANWGTLLKYKPLAIIYDGYSVWQEWDSGAGTEVAGTGAYVVGRAYDNFGAFIGTVSSLFGRYPVNVIAYGIIPHEVAHLYQAQNGGFNGAPVWFLEGNAEFFNAYQPELDQEVEAAREFAASGVMPSLTDLTGYSGGTLAYEIGVSFWIWLTETYGEETHLAVMELLARQTNWKDALERVTNRPFIELETQFREWLGAEVAVPPTSYPTETLPAFFPTPTFPPTRTPTP